jgi:hypothetical protein
MLADTTVERKAAPPVFDQAVPVFRKRQVGATTSTAPATRPEDERNMMQFMLLSKKGNKPQVGYGVLEVADNRYARSTFR